MTGDSIRVDRLAKGCHDNISRMFAPVLEITECWGVWEPRGDGGWSLHAVGGFAYIRGERWAFLDVRGTPPSRVALKIFRAVRSTLQTQDSPVRVGHDTRFPQSERLLRLLGFKETDQFHNGIQAWIYTNDRT